MTLAPDSANHSDLSVTDIITSETPSPIPVDQFIAKLTEITTFIRIYVDIVIILIGITGNILSLVIFRRYKDKDHASVFYLSWLSGVDLTNLILYLLLFWSKFGLVAISNGRVQGLSPADIHPWLCKLSRYFVDTSRFMSAWIIIAFSCERCLAVWFPLKFAMTSSKLGRRSAIVCLLLIALTTNISILVYFKVFVEKGTRKCFYHLQNFSAWSKFLIVFGNITAKSFLLPCAVLIVLNILIILGIRRTTQTIGRVLDKRAKAEKRCLVNLLVVSTVHILLNLPYVLLWTYYNIENFFHGLARHSPAEIQMLHSIGSFGTSLTVMNYSLNFIIYAQSLEYYRAELKRMFRPCCPHSLWTKREASGSASDIYNVSDTTARNGVVHGDLSATELSTATTPQSLRRY